MEIIFYKMKLKNPKVVVFSIIALICLVLSFTIDWFFILVVIVLMYLNQKELMSKNETKKRD